MLNKNVGHIGRYYKFDVLKLALEERVDKGLISRQDSWGGHRIYCYTDKCVKTKAWDDFTKVANGLVLDILKGIVAATPIPKVFNIDTWRSEKISFPNAYYDITEKIDGEQVTLFHTGVDWFFAGKREFNSPVARWMKEKLKHSNIQNLPLNNTYCFEVVCSLSQGIISYEKECVYLLTAYDQWGMELNEASLNRYAQTLGVERVPKLQHQSISQYEGEVFMYGLSQEGVVISWHNGKRMSIISDGFSQAHENIKVITPLIVWAAMLSGEKLSNIRKEMPEQFWGDFNTIVKLLQQKLYFILQDVKAADSKYSKLTDKELGEAIIKEIKLPHVKRLIFPYRKQEGNLFREKARQVLFEYVRPNNNILNGYTYSVPMTKYYRKEAA